MSNIVLGRRPRLGEMVYYHLQREETTSAGQSYPDVLPAMIVRVIEDDPEVPVVNLTLFPDGAMNDGYPWRTHVHRGQTQGRWDWIYSR